MRTFDRFLAVVLALVGFVAGALLVVEIAYRALGNRGHALVAYEPAAAFVRRHPWSAGVVITIAVVMIVVGLALVLAELKPRRAALLVLQSEDADVTAALPRRSVGRVVEASAAGLSGVDSTSAKVRGRRVVLTAHTPLRDAGDLQAAVTQQAQDALSALRLRRTPSLTVRLRKEDS
jgi:hypothetical protein